MPITQGGTTVPVDSAAVKVWGLFDGTNLWLPYRANGRGWWTGAYTTFLTQTITRPANTTAYAAGDVISTTGGAVIAFTGAHLDNGGSGLIIAAHLIVSTNEAADLVADLVLFDATVTAVADNSPMVDSDAEAVTYIGTVPFTTPTDLGANNVAYTVTGLNLPYVCGASSTSIFGLLVARNAYTPASAAVFTLRLGVQLN